MRRGGSRPTSPSFRTYCAAKVWCAFVAISGVNKRTKEAPFLGKGSVMNQHAKVGLFVLGLIALGIFLADQNAITPHRQFDPIFILIMLVIGGLIWFAGSRN